MRDEQVDTDYPGVWDVQPEIMTKSTSRTEHGPRQIDHKLQLNCIQNAIVRSLSGTRKLNAFPHGHEELISWTQRPYERHRAGANNHFSRDTVRTLKAMIFRDFTTERRYIQAYLIATHRWTLFCLVSQAIGKRWSGGCKANDIAGHWLRLSLSMRALMKAREFQIVTPGKRRRWSKKITCSSHRPENILIISVRSSLIKIYSYFTWLAIGLHIKLFVAPHCRPRWIYIAALYYHRVIRSW